MLAGEQQKNYNTLQLFGEHRQTILHTHAHKSKKIPYVQHFYIH